MNKSHYSMRRGKALLRVPVLLILCLITVGVSFQAVEARQAARTGHIKRAAPRQQKPNARRAHKASGKTVRSLKPTAQARALAPKGKDVVGWQNGWWGMTTEEMLRVYGKALRKLESRGNYGRMYADYEIPRYQVSIHTYDVLFQMQDGRLRQVLISPSESASGRAYGRMFDSLDALLTQRYGPPRYKEDSEKTGVSTSTERRRQWVFPTTTMELYHNRDSELQSSNYLYLSYYPTKSSEANKL